ncbi:four-carbon acid sugar kinase family protein [Methylobacterium planeticum]|uniref:Four-carbon acid sugar kinase family protein n=1 Tax=Methylobacterium planeticum TaxID=2615211 RepID=A0A6N6MP75_9HYPH|nr:four-carbon acid sugar kinase family protein [Methylobacterium planeticum]KAB1072290.1 four-carbon acid sugar kinase family protein [Methylobacterium planeticum]
MAGRWLILADDLTGAADCAIAFGRRGREAAVTWGEAPAARGEAANLAADQPEVLSYDADSRGLSAQDATRRHAGLLSRLLDPDRTLFKKIDSTLRGQPAAETVAAIAALKARAGSAFGVCAPAFPATGRTTIGGRVHVNGRPLEEAEVWRRDHTYASADLAAILASAGIRAETIALSGVRGDLAGTLARVAALGDVVAVCDAETEADLDRIARASLPGAPSTFFIGSAGLAHALAAIDTARPAEALRLTPNRCGALIVVGSLAAASRAAARTLAASGRVTHLPVTPEALLGAPAGRAALAAGIAAVTAAGGDALVEIAMDATPDMALGPRLVQSLADALEPVASRIGAFAATGGETAAALLTRFGVSGIRLVDEIEPGVSLGLSLGRFSIPVATKAGAFGDADSLLRIAARLRAVRTEGSFT